MISQGELDMTLEGKTGLDQTGPPMEAGLHPVRSKGLMLYFNTRGNMTYKLGALEPDHLGLSSASWVTPGRLLSLLEPQCSPLQENVDNGTSLAEVLRR